MRPNASVETSNEYECVDCGRRVEAPSTRRCTDCQGRLLNVGTERDL